QLRGRASQPLRGGPPARSTGPAGSRRPAGGSLPPAESDGRLTLEHRPERNRRNTPSSTSARYRSAVRRAGRWLASVSSLMLDEDNARPRRAAIFSIGRWNRVRRNVEKVVFH